MVSLRSILSPDGLREQAAEISGARQARAVGVAAVREAVRMASLSSVADRVKAKKASYGAKAEGWAARLDKLDKIEPAAFAATDAAITAAEADLSGMEADMRALTNGNPTS